MSTIVFYHSPCMDGFGAAWATHHLFCRHSMKKNVEWFPITYGDPFPLEKCVDRYVVFVDFSLKKEPMQEAINKSDSMVILDHHKTAEAELSDLVLRDQDHVLFDMDKSGAVLAWEYFNREEPVPLLLQYVQDRDLWRFDLPDSNLVNDWIAAFAKDDFDCWDSLSHLIENSMPQVLSQAQAIRAYKDRAIELALPHAHKVEFDGFKGLAVNQSSENLISEIAGSLAEDADFGCCYFRKPDGTWVVSLRSRHGVDVSEIARKRGGGGHAAAAGFQASEPPAIWHWMLKNPVLEDE